MFKLYLILVFFLISCTEKSIFQEGKFESVFNNKKDSAKNILIVLSNRSCTACDILYRRIENSAGLKKQLSNDYLCYNFPVDIVGNDFLAQLLYDYRFPLMIFLSSEGNLNAIWKGAREAEEIQALIKYLKKKDKKYETNSENFLGMSGENYASMISFTLKAYLYLQNKQISKAKDNLELSFKYGTYFYNLYLFSKVGYLQGDSISAMYYAEKALALESNNKLDSLLYGRLREELQFILGKEIVGQKNENTIIVFDNITFNCGEVKHNQPLEFSFQYRNIGKVPVIIADIQKSCNCMEVDWDKSPVLPNKSGKIIVKYDTSRQGVFSKIIFVCFGNNHRPIPLFIKGIVV